MEKARALYELLLSIEHAEKDSLLERAKSLVGTGGAIYTPNPIMLYDALQYEKLYSALMRGANIPDGVGIKIGFSYIGIKSDIIAGVDLAKEIISGSDCKFAVIGGEIGRARLAGAKLEEQSCGGKCVLALDGYSYSKRQLEIALDIANADIVLVCLGSPRQEIFIDEIRDKFKKTLFLGLGGSVDIYSGAKRRAPKLLRKLHLEWLYRMIREPRRFLGIFKIIGFLYYARQAKKYRPKKKKSHALFKNKAKKEL